MKKIANNLGYLAGSPLAILITAFLLRLLWGVAIPIVPVSDSMAYDVFAQNIASGSGYGWEPHQPTAFWPVGTSAIYALIYWIVGHNFTAIMLLQVAIGVALVALGMSLARRWFDSSVSNMTGWILACWPLLIQYTTILASEMYFMFFVLLAFWITSGSSRNWIVIAVLAGVALAAASYIRPTALAMAPLLYLTDYFAHRRRLRSVTACIVTVMAMLICILPWSVRNFQVFDQFVLISTNGGSNLWMGNNKSGSIAYMSLPALDIPNEADRDRYLGREARAYIAQDPLAFVVRMSRKLVRLHDRESIGVVWNEKGIVSRTDQKYLMPLKAASSAYWLLILAAASLGIVIMVRNHGVPAILVSPVFLSWAYFSLIHAITVAGDRYHVPSIPFIAMLAAFAVLEMRRPKAATGNG